MIFVECNPDFKLVQELAKFPRKDIVHEAKGKGSICSLLSKRINCTALLDDDSGSPQPPYLSTLHSYRDIQEHNIIILQDNSRNNFVVLLLPKLEDWIIRAARLSDLDMKSYGLPNTANELHREINHKLDKFGLLLTDLKNKQSPMIISLTKALRIK
jgi:hypothetical protein